MPADINIKSIWPLLKRTFNEWFEDKVPKMSAALAYYVAVSLAPLLVIIVKVVGVVFGPKAAAGQLHGQIASLAGPQVAEATQEAIVKAGHPGSGTLATILSIIVAMFAASGVFGELQDSLNTIWEVRPKPDRGIMGTIGDRFFSMTMVLGCAFLLLVSMAASTVLTRISDGLLGMLFGTDGRTAMIIGYAIDFWFSFAVITVVFAAIYKVLPDAQIGWRDVWLGAIVTAILFQIGKYGLSLYLAKAAPGSAYGAAGSFVALLLWVCYSAYILFLGAEFTQVYANEYGTRIVPSANAEPLTEEMRRQAGIPHDEPKMVTRQGLTSSQPRSRKRCESARRNHLQRRVYASSEHRSYVLRFLPVAAGVVVGRFAWKRYHHEQPTGQSLKQQWIDAAMNWKRLATSFVSDSPRRYAKMNLPM
jgi:membrane protein